MNVKVLDCFNFNGIRETLENVDVKCLFDFEGDFITIDAQYGVHESDEGFTLVLIDVKDPGAWIDGIFETREELDSRVTHVRETLEKMSLLDESI